MRHAFLAASLLVALGGNATTFTVTSSNDSGSGSLRQAILDANASPGRDEIVSSLVYPITVLSELPAISDAVTISSIHIIGDKAGPSNGIIIAADSSAVTGLSVTGFAGDGIVLRNVRNVIVSLCYASSNGGAGIVVDGGSNNVVGGGRRSPFDPRNGPGNNVASGNRGAGIVVNSPWTTIFGNDVGPFLHTGNGSHGVLITGGTGIRVEGNHIFHNEGDAIHVRAGTARIDGNTSGQNRGRGIALGDLASSNDSLDTDEGPNGLQNRPALHDVASNGFATRITGILHSKPDYEYDIVLYTARRRCTDQDIWPTGVAFRLTTNSEGDAQFSEVLPGSWLGEAMTLLAISNYDGATSELAPCFVVRRDSNSQSDIAIRQVPSAPVLVSGADGFITIEATNNGPGDASVADIRASIPAGATIVSASLLDHKGDCFTLGQCRATGLGVGETARVLVRIRVTGPVGSTIQHTARSVRYEFGQPDPDAGNDLSTITIPIVSGDSSQNVDLRTILRFQPAYQGAERDFTLQADIKNQGTTTATNVRVRLEAAGATLKPLYNSGGVFYCVPTGPGTCTIPFLPPGTTQYASAGGTIGAGNTATASVTAIADELDRNERDNRATAETTVPVPPISFVAIPMLGWPMLALLGCALAAFATFQIRN